MRAGALVLTRSGKLETKPVSLSFLSKVSTNAAWGQALPHLPGPNQEPAKRSGFGAELPQECGLLRRGGAAADTTAELGCGSACHGKPPRVSCDPSGFGSMQRGFLRCRWRALTAPAQETGVCRTPLTVFLPYRPTALVSAVSSIRQSLPQQECSYPPNRCGRPIRWLRASANRVCHLRCVRRFPVWLRRSGV